MYNINDFFDYQAWRETVTFWILMGFLVYCIFEYYYQCIHLEKLNMSTIKKAEVIITGCKKSFGCEMAVVVVEYDGFKRTMPICNKHSKIQKDCLIVGDTVSIVKNKRGDYILYDLEEN